MPTMPQERLCRPGVRRGRDAIGPHQNLLRLFAACAETRAASRFSFSFCHSLTTRSRRDGVLAAASAVLDQHDDGDFRRARGRVPANQAWSRLKYQHFFGSTPRA